MNTMPSFVDVLIVGAGPTGLTLACDLARRNVDLPYFKTVFMPQFFQFYLRSHWFFDPFGYFLSFNFSSVPKGSLIVKIEPRLSSLSTSIDPSHNSTMRFTNVNPSPFPAVAREASP